MTPPTDKLEAQTREEIDAKLVAAGWLIQDKKAINLMAGVQGINGVAIREMDTDTGPADYMLFIQGKACGIIEAKREGANLGSVAEQSGRYATSGTKHIKRWSDEGEPLPFLYEATNQEIRYRDECDPNPRSRKVFHFHQPKTLKNRLEAGDSFRHRLQQLPGFNTTDLRDCQIDALNKAKQLLKQYRQSVLKSAVTGELTKEWREQNKDKLEPASQLLERILTERRQKWEEQQLKQFKAKGKMPKNDKWKKKYKEPLALESIPQDELPETWKWVALGEVFEVYVGATPSRKNANYWGEELSWVSSGEVAFCRIKGTKEMITKEGLNNSSTELHPPGTVMLGMIGEGKTRGQAAILDIEAAHNQNTAAIEKYIKEQSSEYLYLYLMQQYEYTRKRGSGNNQKALNKTRVQAIEFPLAPLSEQAEISKLLDGKFSAIERLEKEINFQLIKTEKNKQSILASAFSGNLQ